MKHFIAIFILLSHSSTYAIENESKSIKSNKLNILAKTHDGKPESWLRYYNVDVAKENEYEKRIYITAKFDVDNVTDMIITDMNSANKECGAKQEKHILYLAFDSSKNVKNITTRIHLPCLVKNKAVLKLVVKTANGGRYYNITTLKAHPDAFGAVYKD